MIGWNITFKSISIYFYCAVWTSFKNLNIRVHDREFDMSSIQNGRSNTATGFTSRGWIKNLYMENNPNIEILSYDLRYEKELLILICFFKFLESNILFQNLLWPHKLFCFLYFESYPNSKLNSFKALNLFFSLYFKSQISIFH